MLVKKMHNDYYAPINVCLRTVDIGARLVPPFEDVVKLGYEAQGCLSNFLQSYYSCKAEYCPTISDSDCSDTAYAEPSATQRSALLAVLKSSGIYVSASIRRGIENTMINSTDYSCGGDPSAPIAIKLTEYESYLRSAPDKLYMRTAHIRVLRNVAGSIQEYGVGFSYEDWALFLDKAKYLGRQHVKDIKFDGKTVCYFDNGRGMLFDRPRHCLDTTNSNMLDNATNWLNTALNIVTGGLYDYFLSSNTTASSTIVINGDAATNRTDEEDQTYDLLQVMSLTLSIAACAYAMRYAYVLCAKHPGKLYATSNAAGFRSAENSKADLEKGVDSEEELSTDDNDYVPLISQQQRRHSSMFGHFINAITGTARSVWQRLMPGDRRGYEILGQPESYTAPNEATDAQGATTGE
jgi:hypothetical protein